MPKSPKSKLRSKNTQVASDTFTFRKQPAKWTAKEVFANSATIFVARCTSAAGFITGVLGALDWSPLLGVSGFDKHQVIGMGIVVFLIGISHEIARRRTLDPS